MKCNSIEDNTSLYFCGIKSVKSIQSSFPSQLLINSIQTVFFHLCTWTDNDKQKCHRPIIKCTQVFLHYLFGLNFSYHCCSHYPNVAFFFSAEWNTAWCHFSICLQSKKFGLENAIDFKMHIQRLSLSEEITFLSLMFSHWHSCLIWIHSNISPALVCI